MELYERFTVIDITVVVAPPNKRRNLVKFFTNKGFKTYNLDSELCLKLGVQDLRAAITEFPRNKLIDAWKKCVDDTFTIMSRDRGNMLSILVCHTIYHSDWTRELFPIFDATYFNKKCEEFQMKVTRTALVIDDLFDRYADLTNPDSLFGDTALFDFMTDYQELEKETSPRPYIDWMNHCMNYLLNWRAQEVTLVQSIIKQLNSDFMLWGLKQNPSVLIEWLRQSKKCIFYLSHPISEPRRQLKLTGKWPELVNIINEFQRKLRENDTLISCQLQ